MSPHNTFDFADNTAVFICQRVFDGSPILHVSHDAEGEWQFLCGGDDHGDGEACKAKVACLGEVVDHDKTLSKLAKLCRNGTATRESVKGEWKLQDHHEEGIRKHIKEFGWSVMHVEADAEGPGFSYSIGLFHSFKRPEVILFGLPKELAQWIINECGSVCKSPKPLELGKPTEGFLEGFPVIFRDVDKKHYKEHFGYALWFFSGPKFPAIQCIWPDKKGMFPWDPQFKKELLRSQPTLGSTEGI